MALSHPRARRTWIPCGALASGGRKIFRHPLVVEGCGLLAAPQPSYLLQQFRHPLFGIGERIVDRLLARPVAGELLGLQFVDRQCLG